jgi:hypothetical protein
MAANKYRFTGKQHIRSISTHKDALSEFQYAEHYELVPVNNDEDSSKYLFVKSLAAFEFVSLEGASEEKMRKANKVIDTFRKTEEHPTVRSQKSIWMGIKEACTPQNLL